MGAVGGIDRHQDRADLCRGVLENRPFRAVGRPDADAVPTLNVAGHQGSCHAVDLGVQSGVGPTPAAGDIDERLRVWVCRRGELEVRADRLLEKERVGRSRGIGVRRAVLLAQASLEHLSAGVARQRVDDHHPARALVAGEVHAAVRLDLGIGRRIGGVAGDDHRQRGLTPCRVRHADERDLGDLGVRGQDVLHLGAVDVLAARDDHVLLAVDHVEVAVLVLPDEVAGVEPAAAEGLGGLVRLVPVLLHHHRAAIHDLADLALRDVVHRRRRRRAPRR